MDADNEDVRAIRALVRAHFDPMRWDETSAPQWSRFREDFLPEALLIPAARPSRAKSLEEFIDRMNTVAAGALNAFTEHTTGMQVLAFGNVAVVLAASEMLENRSDVHHDVSAYLLVKDAGGWRIAAHAWDHADAQHPVPASLC